MPAAGVLSTAPHCRCFGGPPPPAGCTARQPAAEPTAGVIAATPHRTSQPDVGEVQDRQEVESGRAQPLLWNAASTAICGASKQRQATHGV